jgi:hypothetical protein
MTPTPAVPQAPNTTTKAATAHHNHKADTTVRRLGRAECIISREATVPHRRDNTMEVHPGIIRMAGGGEEEIR